MKPIPRAALVLLLAMAGCVPAPKAPPRVPPPPPPPPVVPPTPAVTDWRDVALTPGTWRYARDDAGSTASFGTAVSSVFALHCDPTRHDVTLIRPAPSGGSMTIRTSYSERTILPRSSPAGATIVGFTARDPFLDQIAFSRGRFSIAGPGMPTLYLPAWAEPGRVIEDCR